MGELTIVDLPSATRDKFADDDAATKALEAALLSARRYCGWHVSPVREDDEFTLDGPCGSVLDLPTGKLNALTSVTENGASVDVAKLDWSSNGSVRKASGGSWSCRYRSIAATVNHGYTEEEAADWRNAIVNMVDAMAPGAIGESGGALIRKKVDDVEYQWSDADASAAADHAVYEVSYVLDSYALNRVLFA